MNTSQRVAEVVEEGWQRYLRLHPVTHKIDCAKRNPKRRWDRWMGDYVTVDWCTCGAE